MNLSAAPLLAILILTGGLEALSTIAASAPAPATQTAATPAPVAQTAATPARTSLTPVINVTGGSDAARQTVLDAVERYASAGLALPDLDINIHPDNTGCDGSRGLFNQTNTGGVIDLCFEGEMLALHELGHAWARYNLNNQARADFTELAGAQAWTGSELIWRERGTELAAQALAHGLLSTPLQSAGQRTTEQQTQAAAYTQWQASQATDSAA